jgi:hypothetical protein
VKNAKALTQCLSYVKTLLRIFWISFPPFFGRLKMHASLVFKYGNTSREWESRFSSVELRMFIAFCLQLVYVQAEARGVPSFPCNK